LGGNSHTSVRSRKAAAELRKIREEAGLSCTDVARMMGMSISKVSRIETGNCGMHIEDVAALLGLYKVPAARREELLDLVRRSEERGWWERQPGLPKLWRTLIDFEAKAVRIQNFEPLVVPGLLQTAEYSRAIIHGINATLSESELDNLVASRMARQTVLTRSAAPQLLAVVDEGALRRPIGDPGVMQRQLAHLATMAEKPNVTLRVVQKCVGSYTGLRGPFVILEFTEEPDLVFVENHGTNMFLEEDRHLAAYRLALSNILAVALYRADSGKLVHSLAADVA
jgi:transcriptional regulator with XRE-family HTH domain